MDRKEYDVTRRALVAEYDRLEKQAQRMADNPGHDRYKLNRLNTRRQMVKLEIGRLDNRWKDEQGAQGDA